MCRKDNDAQDSVSTNSHRKVKYLLALVTNQKIYFSFLFVCVLGSQCVFSVPGCVAPWLPALLDHLVAPATPAGVPGVNQVAAVVHLHLCLPSVLLFVLLADLCPLTAALPVWCCICCHCQSCVLRHVLQHRVVSDHFEIFHIWLQIVTVSSPLLRPNWTVWYHTDQPHIVTTQTAAWGCVDWSSGDDVTEDLSLEHDEDHLAAWSHK